MTTGMIEEIRIEGLPQGYTARPPQMRDLDAVIDMLNAYALAVDGEANVNADRFRREWQIEKWDRAKYSRMILAPDGSLAAWIECWNIHPPYVRPQAWGRVHPSHIGRGIGT